MAEVVIHFGGAEAEYLTLTLHGRVRPHAADYWDSNWLVCTAEVCASTFRGLAEGCLRNEEIGQFYDQVAELYKRLTGEALLDTLEGWFNLCLIGDGKGHIEARGQLCDDVSFYSNMLKFRLSFDQTYLPLLMRQLQAALETFPVIGRPEAK